MSAEGVERRASSTSGIARVVEVDLSEDHRLARADLPQGVECA
ncbi:hypothetical protein [Tsukamurella soli]